MNDQAPNAADALRPERALDDGHLFRLVELTANKSSFRTIRFNPTGPSLIVGSRTSINGSAGDKTYNGVGKSLAIALIHFCLGSNKIRAFEDALPGWEFQLTFRAQGITRRVRRNTSHQGSLFLDDREVRVRSLAEELAHSVFDLPPGIERLGFRSLLPKFLRRGRKDYMLAEATSADHTEYERLLRNAFLLGLDLELIAEKFRLKQRWQQIDNSQKSLRSDPVLREFYSANRDVDIELSHIEERVEELGRNQRAFEVAENYYEVEQEADGLSAQLQKLKNKALVLRNAIANVDRSLSLQPDVTPDRIDTAYGEIKAAFKDETVRHLEEVHDFHRRLVEKRTSRLSEERHRLQRELTEQERRIRDLNGEFDQKVAYLGHSRALDYFVTIGSEISALKAKAQKLHDYRELGRRWSDELAQVKASMQQEVIRTNQYLSQARNEIEAINGVFKHLSRRLYPDAPAGISLHNNEGDNQVRFDFEVRIENDASDGINEARIFCYDLTLLTAGHNHRMGFVFHDSRLFSDMDPRQRAELFRVAHEQTQTNGRQYIATLNEDQIDAMAPYLSAEDKASLIDDRIVLALGDAAAEEKLLGVQIDMHYE